jgi:hypothetical protein
MRKLKMPLKNSVKGPLLSNVQVESNELNICFGPLAAGYVISLYKKRNKTI